MTSELLISTPEPFSSERLAAQLHARGYAHMHDFLPERLLVALQAEARAGHQAGSLQPAAIGRGTQHKKAHDIRSDKTEWIEGKTPAQAAFLEALEALRLEMNQHLMLGLMECEAHYAAYERGAYYARHRDSFAGAQNRILSLVLYLNETWSLDEGGLLHLFSDDCSDVPCASILPLFGYCVIFLSEDIPHEVSPVHSDKARLSIAAWLRRRPT